jgi:hypothetical protein
MLNYGFWPRHLIIMLNYEKEIGAINDDLGWNLCNLRNPQKWHNFPPKFFMYRKRAWVQALPWFEICAEGTCQKLLKGTTVLRSFSLFGNSDRLAGNFSWSEDRRTAWLLPSTTEVPTCSKQVSSGNGAENTKEKSRQCFTACSK